MQRFRPLPLVAKAALPRLAADAGDQRVDADVKEHGHGRVRFMSAGDSRNRPRPSSRGGARCLE